MPYTPVSNNATSNNGAGGTLAVALTGVHVGDLIVVTASCAGTGAMTCSDGTSTLTPLTQISTSNSSITDRVFYLLASLVSGTVTYTITFTGTPTSRSMEVFVQTPSAACLLDQSTAAETIASTAGASGNVTTTIADQICFGAQSNENQSASSVEKVNGVAATTVINSGTNATLWYTTPNTTFTGQVTETIGSSTRTLTSVVTFGIPPPPVFSYNYTKLPKVVPTTALRNKLGGLT